MPPVALSCLFFIAPLGKHRRAHIKMGEKSGGAKANGRLEPKAEHEDTVFFVAVAKQGAESTIRVQIPPGIPHLALLVQQFALAAAEVQITAMEVGFGTDGISVRQRELLVLLRRSVLRCKHGIILRPPILIAFFMGDILSAH